MRPRCLMSKGFGGVHDEDVISHIRKGIKFALDTGAFFPYFISRVNGSTYPLAPYYSKKFLTIYEKAEFFSRRPPEDVTPDDVNDFLTREQHLKDMRNFLNQQVNYFDFEEIDNINTIYFDYGEIPKDAQSDSCFADSWQDFDNFDNSSS